MRGGSLKRLYFTGFFAFLCVLALAAGLRADTPTATPTSSPSPTATASPTPAQAFGSYAVVPNGFSPSTNGQSLSLEFMVGAEGFNNGWLQIIAPTPFTTAVVSVPSNESVYFAASPTVTGLTFTANLTGVPPGTILVFNYSFGTSGASGPSSFLVSSVDDSVNTGDMQALPAQPPVYLFTQTATPTDSPTATPSFTVSPTFSASPTITPTWTESPIANASTAYTYPNPFDLRVNDKVTFVFPLDSDVQIRIWDLAGHPVLQGMNAVDPAADPSHYTPDKNGQWMIWNGTDDYGSQVAGGLYLYRVKGKNRTWTGKFTVLH
jgi:hypothetical protein